MKYKIKNHIIDAKSPVEALKIHKLLTSKVKDAKNYKIYQKTPWGEVFIAEWEHNSKEEAVKEFLEFNPKYANRGVIIAKDSVKDNDLDYLTEEEERAVDDYRKAIENTSNPKLLKLYQHILEEELEHIDELTSAEITEDACKTKDDRLNISSLLSKAKEFAENDEYQKVANICSNIISSLKQMKEAK